MSAADASLVEDLEQLGTTRVACWLITPRNWFDLPLAAARCAADGTTLGLTVQRNVGDVPLAALRLADLQAVYETVRSWWQQLSGSGRPSSLPQGVFDALLIDIRQTLQDRADLTLREGKMLGSPATLQLPPLDHALLADDAGALQLLRPLLQLEPSPAVQAAVAEWSTRAELESVGRRRPWLRVILQKALFDDPASTARKTLQAIYAHDATELLRAEAEALRGNYLAATAEQWRQHLGIEGASHRVPAFDPAPPTATAAPAGKPDTTVLIPSFQHAEWIEATIGSALAQTHGDIAVLVVDDKSSDATVARARAIDDPRLRVRVNRSNMGLGNSVLAALDRVETPFVALLNSDDLFHPQRLERCLQVLASDASCQLVTTGLALVDRASHRLTPTNVSRLADGDSVHAWVHWFEGARPSSVPRAELFGELLQRNFLVTSSNIVCRTDWLRSKADSLQSLKYCVDWQLFLDAASEGALVHIPDELLGYRLHDSNTVWFSSGRRWAYTLEVSRVAARAVQSYVAALPAQAEARVAAVLQLVSDRLQSNTEVDGLDLYLNQLLDGPLLERLDGVSKTVRALLERIERQRPRAVEDAGQQVRNEARGAMLVVLRDAVQQLRGQQKAWIETEAWLRGRIVEEEAKLQQTEQQKRELRAGFEADVRAREQRIAGLVAEVTGLESTRVALRRQLADAVVRGNALESDLRHANETLTAATTRMQQLEARNGELDRQLTAAVQQAQLLGTELDARTEALATARAVQRLAQADQANLPELRLGLWLWRHGGRRVVKWRQRLRSMVAAMRHRGHRLLHPGRPIVLMTASPTSVGAEAHLAQRLADVAAAGAEPVVFSFHGEVAGLAAPHRSRTLASFHQYAANQRFWSRRAGPRFEAMLASIAAATGIPRESVLSLAEVQRALGLARAARVLKPRLAAAPSFAAALETRVAAWLGNTPWCLWLDGVPTKPLGLDAWIVRELPTAALLVVTSPALVDALVALGVSRERIVVAHGPATTSTQPSPDRGHLLSSHGSAERSDWSLLVAAVQEVARHGTECAVELVSAQPLDLEAMVAQERLHLQIERAGLGDRIKLRVDATTALGRPMAFVAAVSPASAQEMCVPSGLPEAMASGLPIVASDVACLRGLLADGVDAILVRPGDTAAMANALQRVLESADLRSALGSSAMARHSAILAVGGRGQLVVGQLKTLLNSIP